MKNISFVHLEFSFLQYQLCHTPSISGDLSVIQFCFVSYILKAGKIKNISFVYQIFSPAHGQVLLFAESQVPFSNGMGCIPLLFHVLWQQFSVQGQASWFLKSIELKILCWLCVNLCAFYQGLVQLLPKILGSVIFYFSICLYKTFCT